jgi:hypothetical protein
VWWTTLGNGDGTFQPAVYLGTFSNPRVPAVGDFNGDGKLDLAIPELGASDVQILLGNGDGTFASPVPYGTGSDPVQVVAADLNHDGKFDLAVANWGDATISVLLGNGDGTFAQQTVYANSGWPYSIAVADFGQSGYPDLVTASYSTGTAQVFLNHGDGTFPASQTYSAPDSAGYSYYFVAVGDFNGDGRPDFAAMSNASVIDVFLSQPTEQVTVSGIAVAGAGAHNVVASYGGDTNFSGSTSSPQSLTAAPVNTTITLADQPSASFSYGSTSSVLATLAAYQGYPAPTGTVSYTVDGGTAQNATLTSGAATLPLSSTLGAGGHTVAVSYAGNTLYNSAANSIPLTVTKANQTITFNPLSGVTYGVSPYSISASASTSSNLSVTFKWISGPATVTSAGIVTITGAGPVTIEADQSGNSNYNAGPAQQQSFSVAKAPLTVNVNSASRVYGLANPTFTGTLVGLVNGDTLTPTYSTTAITTSPIGNYPITATLAGTALPNYSVTVNPSTLTVTKTILTVTVNSATRVYGAADPTFTGTITGLVNGDTVTATYSSTDTVTSPVGTYPITPTLSGAALANYTQNIVNGTLTVTKAAATITVNSTSRTYGAANPTFTGTITGALNGDVLTATYSATTATVTSSVGTYPITAVLTGTASGNYNATVVPGTLTVGQATLNIGVNSFTKVYGSVNPTFTGSVTGVLNGDSITTTYSTTATQYSPVNVGGYPITASISGAAASNYTAVVTPGTLTVTPAVVTVTINPATRIYGAANPTFTGTLAGVLNGDAVTGVYSTTATVQSYVGTYPITATLGGSAAGNYTANVIGANLTITAAPLMVTANSLTSVYGSALPTLGYTVTGFVNGDTVGSATTGAPTLGTSATSHSAVGSYPTTASLGSLAATNYNFQFVNGTLTITPATLTVTATNASRTYGTANPTFAYTITGFVNGDAQSVVGGSATETTVATPTTTVGNYAITFATEALTASNYTFNYVNGNLTIIQATPVISWSTPAAITYGTALSATQLNATSGGVAGTFTYSPTTGAVLTAGQQTLSVNFAPTDSTDYTSASGTVQLTVNKATPTITWATPAAITYGTALTSTQLNATSGGVNGTFTYSPLSGTVLDAGSQTLSVTFAPTNTTDYTSATGTVQLTVNKATPAISWSTPAAIAYGTALSATQLDATSGGVAGTFGYSPAAGAVLTAGSQTLSVTFTPTDSTDYTTANGSVQLTVNQATPTMSWSTPAAITYGTALSSAQLNATSGGVNGTFTYTPASGTVLGAGTQTLSVTFKPTDTTDYVSATTTVQLTVSAAVPAIGWTAPAAIAYGTALSATQLDASSTVAGSFAYTPAAGVVLDPGTQTLSVIFTPTDIVDYTTATISVSLTVEPPASVYTAPAADVGAVIGGQTATILLPNGFTLGSIAVVTQGAPNLDFKFVSGGTCTVGSTYTADEVCTVNYSFNPTVPGLRIGAVNLYDNTTPTPVLQATVYLNGTGVGPQLVFNTPLTANSLGSGSGFNNPYGAAVDGSGNLYVADAGNNLVTERPAGCASLSCVTTLGGGFSRPTGVAVDGSGNVYVADQGNSAVKEMPSGCASSSCVTTLGGGFSRPTGVAVDGSGNVYVADQSNNAIKEMPSGCTTSGCVTTLGGNIPTPYAVAVDSSGNVWVPAGDNVLHEITPGCTSSSCVGALSLLSRSGAQSVALDGAGDIYIAEILPNDSNNVVLELPVGCTSASCVITVGSGLVHPVGLAVDGSGNLYVADEVGVAQGSVDGNVKEIARATAPSLSFATTPAGAISSDSPQTVTVENVGNAALTFPIPASGKDPSITTGFTLNSSASGACPLVTPTSSTPGSLAAGASCSLAISFKPVTSGSATGSLTLTDQNLNTPGPNYAVQSIQLSGNSTPGSPTINSVSAILPQQTQTITISGSGFGAQAAYTGDSNYIELVDTAGSSWQAGHAGSSVALAVSSWTDSQIVLSGFSGSYGTNGWCISPGDQLSFRVWNAQTGAGPAVYPITASSGTNTCTLAISSVSAILPQQTQTITINGSDFGTQAAYTGDSNYIELVDSSGTPWNAGHGTSAVTLAVSSWTNTQIVLSGLSGAYGTNGWCISPGDQLSVEVWNAQSGKGPAVYPITASSGTNTCVLAINSVSPILPQQTQTITINGTDFGTRAAYTGDSNYIELVDTTAGSWSAGHGVNAVTLAVSSWTNTQIVLSGFSGAYGTNGWCISPGDQLSVQIWNAQSGQGPAVYPVVASGGPNTCTLAINSVSQSFRSRRRPLPSTDQTSARRPPTPATRTTSS